MASRNLLQRSWSCITANAKWANAATFTFRINTVSVRHRHRRYRDQHEKQAIPINKLQENRQPTHTNDTNYTTEDLQAARRYKFVHPEFLPSVVPELRDSVCEKLEREDMMRRRSKLDIPEFYVGSLMAVTLSDPYADGQQSRFVGICIERTEVGLRHNFTLRNNINGQGIEIMYELYNPTILKIEVLKLEKRLDEELFYLRDCPAEYSTVPFDLEATPHPKGAPVPINPIKIKLNPRPWKERWERSDMQGIYGFEEFVSPRLMKKAQHKLVRKPWEKYDLVKKYRESVVQEDGDAAYLDFTKAQERLEKRKAAELDSQIESDRK